MANHKKQYTPPDGDVAEDRMTQTRYRVEFDMDGSNLGGFEMVVEVLRRRCGISRLDAERCGPGGGNPRIVFVGGLDDALYVASFYCGDARDVVEFFRQNVMELVELTT